MFNRKFSSNLRHRKRMVLALLSFCVVIIGIGYAAFEANLSMNGVLTVKGKTTVTFDVGDGTVSPSTKKVMVGEAYGSLPIPTRDEYTFLNWEDLKVPFEYQEIEYVKFNAGSFIDTNIIPTNHTTEIKFDYETYTSDEFLLGTSKGSNYYYTSAYNNKYVFGHDGNKSWTGYGSWTTGDHHLIYNGEDNSIILDGALLESGYGIASDTTLWIGKRSSTANLSGKVYYVKITDKTTGELVRNMIPCYRKIDEVIGFYDTVNDVFYTNNGSSEFEKGNDVRRIIDENTIVSNREDHILYAMWGHNPTITFDANGGEVSPSTKTITYNSNYGELPTPTREGYRFEGWKTNNIPEGYQEIEYIGLTGTQYIDTKYALWKDQNWKMEFKFDVSQFYDYDNMFGSLGTTNTNNEIWIANDARYYLRMPGPSKITIATLSLNTPYTIIHDNTGTNLLNYVNGDLVNTASRATTSFNYKLGFGHREGSKYLKGKIYYLKFWSNGELVRDMVPCYRKSDDVVGMYDLVTKKFYPNAGSGNFNKGPDASTSFAKVTSSDQTITNSDHTLIAQWKRNPIVTFNPNGGNVNPTSKRYEYNSNYVDMPTPTRTGYRFVGWNTKSFTYEYQRMDYIKFNAGNLIDTGIIPKNHTTEIEFDYETYTSDEFLFGTANSASYYYTAAYDNQYVFGHDGNKSYTSYGTWSTGKHHLLYNGENNSIVLDGTTLESGYGISSPTTLWLGRRENTTNFDGKIYYVKITDKQSGDVVRYMVPCYRKNDNVIGMYDLVNGVFYENQGSSSFTKGNDIDNYDSNTDIFNFVTSNDVITTEEDQTLYAIWEEE